MAQIAVLAMVVPAVVTVSAILAKPAGPVAKIAVPVTSFTAAIEPAMIKKVVIPANETVAFVIRASRPAPGPLADAHCL